MWRRKRSRPSSKRRLTKKVKRLSSGKSACASAIGVVDEHKLRTNGPVVAAGAVRSPASGRAMAPGARCGVGDVIASPGPVLRHERQGEATTGEESEGSRALRGRGRPPGLGNGRGAVWG